MSAVQTTSGRDVKQSNEPAPKRIVEIELSQPLPTISAFDAITHLHYQSVICLIRLHTQPLGVLELPLASETLLPEEYTSVIWQAFRDQITQHLLADSMLPVNEIDAGGLITHQVPLCVEDTEHFLVKAPFISVIVPTRDRPDTLAKCIDSLIMLHYPQYEIIIVDNASETDATFELVQQKYQHIANLHYIREERQGSSFARNRGCHEAKGEIFAFADDDVVVDTHWLAQIARTFNLSEDIVCVTGFTLPLELNTPSQIWFEDASWITDERDKNKKLVPRIFDKRTRHRQLYNVSLCGHGANMATKASFFHHVGGFDLVLGPGTPTMGGEDIAFYFHVIMHNKILAYAPGALAHHLHRRDYDKLRKQVYGYGVGYTAYLTHLLLRYPVLWFDLLTKVPYDIVRVLLRRTPEEKAASSSKRVGINATKLKGVRKSTNYPLDLTIVQIRGFLYGPFAYLKSRLAIHNAHQDITPKAENVQLNVTSLS
jgi:glycosyltransferase involved in cell wall biosynthesis